MDLVKVIRQIESDIQRLENKHEEEIKKTNARYETKISELKTALNVNMNMNTTCLSCEGRGRIASADAAGQTERNTCEACGGSGEIRNKHKD